MSAVNVMPPLDMELRWILGRPCFTIIGIAEALRALGHTIPRKAEAEQAASIHWMLNVYLEHGPDKWREEAEKALQIGKKAKEGK